MAVCAEKNALWGKNLEASGRKLSEDPPALDLAVENDGYGYETAMGRACWPSPDPIGERGGMNLYGMVGNDPINKHEILGLFSLGDALDSLERNAVPKDIPATPGVYVSGGTVGVYLPGTPAQYSDQKIFDEWYRLEKTRGAWWSGLPKCPRCISVVSGSAKNPEPNKWKDPKRASNAEENLHPGTFWSLRSKPDGAGHSNQCTYDKDGALLEDIPSAGSADWFESGTLRHYDHDVAPAYLASRLDGGSSMGVISSTIFNGPKIQVPPGANINKYYEVRPFWPE